MLLAVRDEEHLERRGRHDHDRRRRARGSIAAAPKPRDAEALPIRDRGAQLPPHRSSGRSGDPAVATPRSVEQRAAAQTPRNCRPAFRAWPGSWCRAWPPGVLTRSTSTRSASRLAARSIEMRWRHDCRPGASVPVSTIPGSCSTMSATAAGRDWPKGSMRSTARCRVPEAFRAAREVLSLPVHQHVTTADVDRIVDEVRAALSG